MTTKEEDVLTWPVVPKEEILKFMVDCMLTVDTKLEHAKVLADVLVTGDNRGHYSHGLNRLDMYVKDIQQKVTSKDKEPEILKQSGATAWVDGNGCLGPVVGKFCMDIAIKKAKEIGVGWVSAKGSNHFGIAGWYSMRAADQGLVGMSFTNTSPFLVPTRSRTVSLFLPLYHHSQFTWGKMNSIREAIDQKKKGKNVEEGESLEEKNKDLNTFTQELHSYDNMTKTIVKGQWYYLPFLYSIRITRSHGLGTNPLSVAANGNNGDSFVLDMATTAVAQGKIEIAHRRKEPIPNGWGCDRKGMQSNDASEILTDGGCLPLGGMEENTFLSDATYGPNVRMWKTRERVADLGQCFIAVDPECFASGFHDRLSTLISDMKSLELAEGETEILVAGDPEKKHINICEQKGGIPYHPNQIKYIMDLAKEFKVEPPPSVTAMNVL